jgi:hypothetical protein
MTVRTSRRLVDDYLAELRGVARGLPRARRRELIGQIEEHLGEAIPADAGAAATRTELDRLGTPAEIVAEEQQRLGPSRAAGGTFEWVAVALLLVGGFVIPILGWIVGVAMLWSSRVWTVREKLIGTLLVPGGLGGAFFWVLILGTSSRSCGGVGARAGHPGQRRPCPGGAGRAAADHRVDLRAGARAPASRAHHGCVHPPAHRAHPVRSGRRADRAARADATAARGLGSSRRSTAARRQRV